MNDKFERFKSYIRGKNVAVIGVGISNRPLIKWLYSLGADITACDKLTENDPSIASAMADLCSDNRNIEWSLGESYLDVLRNKKFDMVFKTPKMRYETEELMVAKNKGCILTTEMELFMDLCPAQIFAITGSDGKTTTTTLVSEILKKAGYKVFLGGNIGTPLLDRIEEVNEDDKVVLELSSFQLLDTNQSADVSIVTNVTPNHLDFHKDYDEYISSKTNVFKFSGPSGKLVLNAGNDITREMAKLTRNRVSYFSADSSTMDNLPGEHVVIDENGDISYVNDEGSVFIMNEKDIFIPGKHNVENYMAAIAAVYDYVSVNDIKYVAKNFTGVQHRIEFIREINNVRWYNSSIDTSPNRTINTMNALNSRGEKGVLICGGADKKCDYTGLGDAILNVCDRIIVYGSNSEFIRDILAAEANGRKYQFIRIDDNPEDIYEFEATRQNVVDNYKKIIQMANDMAKPGEVVIMSNVGTSYDHFRHFEHRGDMFKELVNLF